MNNPIYSRNITLMLTPIPLSVLLTTTPVALMACLDLGRVNVKAISCPMDEGVLVLINIPSELKF